MEIPESVDQGNESRLMMPIIGVLGYAVGGSRDTMEHLMRQQEFIRESAHAILERARSASVTIDGTEKTILAILEGSYQAGRSGWTLYKQESTAILEFIERYLRKQSSRNPSTSTSAIQGGRQGTIPANDPSVSLQA